MSPSSPPARDGMVFLDLALWPSEPAPGPRVRDLLRDLREHRIGLQIAVERANDILLPAASAASAAADVSAAEDLFEGALERALNVRATDAICISAKLAYGIENHDWRFVKRAWADLNGLTPAAAGTAEA